MINIKKHNKNQRGATALIVAVVLIILIGVGALAIDLGFAYFQRTNLQKAADAAALAGARALYQNDGKTIHPQDAEIDAKSIAVLNASGIDNDQIDVKIGHWAFGINDPNDNRFHEWDLDQNPNPVPVNLTLYTGDDLDGVTDHINAVQVIVELESPSFFSRIWGSQGLSVNAEAVAYLGFAGSAAMFEFDLPLAVCEHSILKEDGTIECNVSRFVPDPLETAMWTDLETCDPDLNLGPSGGANANSLDSKIPNSCVNFESAVDKEFYLGEGIKTINGMTDSVYQKLHSCWVDVTNKDKEWTVQLPVIGCDSNTCNKVLGAVTVDIIWIHSTGGNDPHFEEIPREVTAGNDSYRCNDCFDGDNWICTGKKDDAPTREACWIDFYTTFNLKDENGNPPDYEKKQLFFRPNCAGDAPLGGTGGQNYGVIAKVPLLVK